MSAAKAADGMTQGEDDFLESNFENTNYVFVNKVRNTSDSDAKIKSYAKIFNHNDLVMQAVIFINDLPDKVAKRNINKRISDLKEFEKKAKK